MHAKMSGAIAARLFLLSLTMVWVFPMAVAAQTVEGVISGKVMDATGAVISGAEVVVAGVETGVARTAVTNAEGFYRVGNLRVGLYNVSVTFPGFETEMMPNIRVTVGQERTADVTLSVEGAEEAVTVTAQEVLIDTASSTVAHLVDQRTVRELPLPGRDWAQLAVLQPGVLQNKAQQANDPRNSVQRGSGMQITIAGSRVVDNNFRLDGIAINDFANTAPGSSLGLNLGVDAVQEFTVLTAGIPAQYGRASGGVINAVTRSGTNRWRGSVYEFFRNDAMDAPNFFDELAGVEKPARRRNQFGGTLGGPIQKNRTFFFVNYEGIRQVVGTTQLSRTLSDQARAGNLVSGRVTVHPEIAPYVEFFPRVNVPGSVIGDTGFYAFPADQTADANFVTARIDGNLGERNQIYGTFMYDAGSGGQADELGTSINTHESKRSLVALSWTSHISATLVSNARVGWSRSLGRNNFNVSLNPTVTDRPELGFVPGFNPGRISVSGLTTFLGATDALDYNDLEWNSYQFYEDVYWQKGNHSLSTGFNLEIMRNDSDSPGTLTGRSTFLSIRDFLTLGTAPGAQRIQFEAQLPGNSAARLMRQKLFGLYLQDNWRVSPRLTLNLGVRWEPATVPTEKEGRLAALRTPFDTETVVGPLFSNPTWKYVSPRLGFAYDPTGNGKRAIRGGFTLNYVLPLTHLLQAINNRATPFFQSVFGELPPGTPLNRALEFSNPRTGRNVAFEHDAPASYKMQWNLNIQEELAANMFLFAGYTGSRSIHQLIQEENVAQNIVLRNPDGTYTVTEERMNPVFNRIDWRHWAGSVSYHGLQLGLKRPRLHGIQFQAAYSWSRILDHGTPTNSNNEFRSFVFNPVPLDTEYNWGPADYDVTHALVLNALWELPSPPSGGLKKVLGGWQLGGILTASSGLPMTPTVNGDPGGLGAGARGKQRTALAPGCSMDDLVNPGELDYLNLACFAVPSPATALEKAMRRNSIRGPGLLNLDLLLSKNIPVQWESVEVQFRIEGYNVLNRANFANPSGRNLIQPNGTPIPGTGTITSTATAARTMQLGLKLIW